MKDKTLLLVTNLLQSIQSQIHVLLREYRDNEKPNDFTEMRYSVRAPLKIICKSTSKKQPLFYAESVFHSSFTLQEIAIFTSLSKTKDLSRNDILILLLTECLYKHTAMTDLEQRNKRVKATGEKILFEIKTRGEIMWQELSNHEQ